MEISAYFRETQNWSPLCSSLLVTNEQAFLTVGILEISVMIPTVYFNLQIAMRLLNLPGPSEQHWLATSPIWPEINKYGLNVQHKIAQRLQKLIYRHLSTDCFMRISLHSLGYIKLSIEHSSTCDSRTNLNYTTQNVNFGRRCSQHPLSTPLSSVYSADAHFMHWRWVRI